MFLFRGLLKIHSYLSARPPGKVDPCNYVSMATMTTANALKDFPLPVRLVTVSAGRAGDARPSGMLRPYWFLCGHIPPLKNLPQLQFQQSTRYSSDTELLFKKKRNAWSPLFFLSAFPSPLMWSTVRKSISFSPQQAHWPPYFWITSCLARSLNSFVLLFFLSLKASLFFNLEYRRFADFLWLSLIFSGLRSAYPCRACRTLSAPFSVFR